MTKRLQQSLVSAIDASPILRVRAGARSDHRFIGIWAVVVNGRVFARSWMQRPAAGIRPFLTTHSARSKWGIGRCRFAACAFEGHASTTISSEPTHTNTRRRPPSTTCAGFEPSADVRRRWSSCGREHMHSRAAEYSMGVRQPAVHRRRRRDQSRLLRVSPAALMGTAAAASGRAHSRAAEQPNLSCAAVV